MKFTQDKFPAFMAEEEVCNKEICKIKETSSGRDNCYEVFFLPPKQDVRKKQTWEIGGYFKLGWTDVFFEGATL